jgi:tRNA threonylcarbamoyladenosine biosynthesis protein TsaB
VSLTILALDTTTRPGSAALLRDGRAVEVAIGDPTRTHGEQLPAVLMTLVDRHGLKLRDVDLYAVAAGPGSFTGLRIGIACVQGLALANDRPVVAVSVLEALAIAGGTRDAMPPDETVAVWMDAQRGEVFAALYAGAIDPATLRPVAEPNVGPPVDILRTWQRDCDALPRVHAFCGDGAVRYMDLIKATLGNDVAVIEPPPLAGVIGGIASRRREAAVHPAAIRPLYIRRSDAELARERASISGSTRSLT